MGLRIDRYIDIDVLIGVLIQHANRRDRLLDLDHALFDRKGRHSSGHVAAVRLIVHLLLADDDLADQILDVDIRLLGLPDDDDLVVGGYGAAHTIDLLRVRAPHRLQEDLIPLGSVRREILLLKEASLRGAATHKYRLEFSHD